MTFSNTGLDKNKYAFLHIFTEDKIIENQSLGKKFYWLPLTRQKSNQFQACNSSQEDIKLQENIHLCRIEWHRPESYFQGKTFLIRYKRLRSLD